MNKRKTYIITWLDRRREKTDAPAAKSYYRYNLTQKVHGYRKAVKTAERIEAYFGAAILWDERGVIEPKNGDCDHSYIDAYWS